jgi:putative MATE family efflux protein
MTLLRQTVRLAVPAMLENLLMSAVFLVDTLMVATLGPAQLGAVGLVGVVMWRMVSMAGSLRIGVGAAIARRWGEGNEDVACRIFSHGALLGFAAGLACLMVLPLGRPLFHLMNARGQVLELIVPYFLIVASTLPMRLTSINIASSIRSAGNTRVPMLTTLSTNLINIGLNYVLIFGKFGMPALGLIGAGIATAIAFTCEFLFFSFMAWRGVAAIRVFSSQPGAAPVGVVARRSTFRFARDGFRLRIPNSTRIILRISHPSFWEEVGITFGFLVFFGMIADFGELSLAAHTAIVRIESFSFLAGFGVSIAAATLVGQSLGAGSLANAKRSFSLCITLGAGFMGFIGILMVLFPDWLLGWFASDQKQAFLAIGVPLMVIVALEQPFIGAAMVMANGLRGAGQTTAPFVAQITGVIFVRVGLGYFLAYEMEMGMQGLYWSTVADWVVRTILLSWLVMRGGWEKTVV